MKFRRRLFTSTINCKQFHVIVIQKQQRNFTEKYGTRVKLLFCLLNLSLLFSFFFLSFFFFYVLVAIASSDRKVDPLKNKRCWNQSLVLFNLLLCQLVVLSRSYRQVTALPGKRSSCHLSIVSPVLSWKYRVSVDP